MLKVGADVGVLVGVKMGGGVEVLVGNNVAGSIGFCSTARVNVLITGWILAG